MGRQWENSEIATLKRMYRSGAGEKDIATILRRTPIAVRNMTYTLRREENLTVAPISESPAQVWKDHLTIEGDALILSDVETPYHHSDFMNRAIDKAIGWGINHVILAGDFVHFANFSHWGPDFQKKPLSLLADKELMEVIDMLPQEARDTAITKLERAGIITPEMGISAEMATVRKTVKELQGAFSGIYYIMGNHENRKLKAQQRAEDTTELLRFFEADMSKWVSSPYYWCILQTSNPFQYRIEHPQAAGRTTAQDLAVQYQQHVIMGHSHRWAMNRDPSGRLYAIQCGHCVDEDRLSYVMQRSAKRDAHALGAVIVRDGIPTLLDENIVRMK